VFGAAAAFMLLAMATVVTLRPRRAAAAIPGSGVILQKAPS
jgi:hypothetical protein